MWRILAWFGYGAFSVTWPAAILDYWNKESICVQIEFNSQGIKLVHYHGCHFFAFEQINKACVTSYEDVLLTGSYQTCAERIIHNYPIFDQVLIYWWVARCMVRILNLRFLGLKCLYCREFITTKLRLKRCHAACLFHVEISLRWCL